MIGYILDDDENLVLVFDDPEPEDERNPLLLRNDTKIEIEEVYKDLQCLPKFLPFSKRKRKLI